MEQCLSEMGLEGEKADNLSDLDKGRLLSKMDEKFVSISIFMNFCDCILHIHSIPGIPGAKFTLNLVHSRILIEIS